ADGAAGRGYGPARGAGGGGAGLLHQCRTRLGASVSEPKGAPKASGRHSMTGSLPASSAKIPIRNGGGPAGPPAQDTVARASATPGRAQPHAELGLTGAEYQRITELLGRLPTDAELAIYSVMWSEHCSYKSSRAHLRQFAPQAPPTTPLLPRL